MTEPWKPNSPFDWDTAGRALSPEERMVLQRLLVSEGKGEMVRPPTRNDRLYHDQE